MYSTCSLDNPRTAATADCPAPSVCTHFRCQDGGHLFAHIQLSLLSWQELRTNIGHTKIRNSK